MKVEFTYSPRDMAEVAAKTTHRSRVLRSWRFGANVGWTAIICAMLFFILPGELPPRAIFAAMFGVALMVFLQKQASSGVSQRMVDYYREQLGGDGPFRCEVELLEAALVVRQLDSEGKYPWSKVASIEEGPEGIEFVFRPSGLMLVRSRAFSAPEAQAAFLALARTFHRQGGRSEA